jgi:hypothetical protein
MVGPLLTILSVSLGLSMVLFADPSDSPTKLEGYIPLKNLWQVLYSAGYCSSSSFQGFEARGWNLFFGPRIHWTPEMRALQKEHEQAQAAGDELFVLAKKIYKSVKSEALDTSLILPVGNGHFFYAGPHDKAMIVIVSPKDVHRAYERNLATPFQDERLRELERLVECKTTVSPDVP